MKIEVVKVTEHEDGDATVIFEMCPDAQSALLGLGIITAIRNAIEENNVSGEHQSSDS